MEPDLAYLPTKNKFYAVFGDHCNVSHKKKVTHGAFEPDFSQVSGLWYIGAKEDLYNPEYSSFYKFVFDVPEDWAHTYVDGNILIAAGSRAAGLRGPSLLAVKAWNDYGSDPEPGAELTYTKMRIKCWKILHV